MAFRTNKSNKLSKSRLVRSLHLHKHLLNKILRLAINMSSKKFNNRKKTKLKYFKIIYKWEDR